MGGAVPATNANIVIAHTIDVDDSRSCNSLTINSGARLNVNASLTVATTSSNDGKIYIYNGGTFTQTAGDFTNNNDLQVKKGGVMVFSDAGTTLTNTGILELQSSKTLFGSLLLSGTYTETGSGTIYYRRYVAGTDYWDLIGSPLSGNSLFDFIDANEDIATNGSSPTAYAIGTYTNTSVASGTNGGWSTITLIMLVLQETLFQVEDIRWQQLLLLLVLKLNLTVHY